MDMMFPTLGSGQSGEGKAEQVTVVFQIGFRLLLNSVVTGEAHPEM